jgi:hypothetical protein
MWICAGLLAAGGALSFVTIGEDAIGADRRRR